MQTAEKIDIETKALSIIEQAESVKITTPAEYASAGELWKAITALEKEVKDTFTPMKEAAHKAHREVCAKEKQHLDPLTNAKKHVKRIMGDYDAEQEKLRLERQRRIEEQLRKEEEERRLQEAIAAEESGQTEEAEAILSEPVTVAPVELAKTTPKLSGGPVFQERWDFEVVNEAEIPREYLMVDTVKIGKVVRALKNQAKIAGIRVFPKRV